MNIQTVLSRFLLYSLEIPVIHLTDQDVQLADFENRHCFSKQVQPMLTAQNMKVIFSGTHPGHLYELRDLLGLRLLFFLFDGEQYVVGPYVTEAWENCHAEQTLASLELPASFVLPYKLYYCAYRLLDENTPIRTITAAITALQPNEPPYLHQVFSGLPGEKTLELPHQESLDFDLVSKRYEQENRFLDMVTQGRPETALKEWKQLGQMPGDQMFSATDRISTSIANATILRTLLRKAAQKGGVHPVVVDALSRAYAQKIYAVRNTNELSGIMPKMIVAFAQAVRDSIRKQYSVPVIKAVTFIEFHLSQSITIEQLADAADISAGSLGRHFKAETGDTISHYIAKRRCENAAELLLNSNLSVQDIGMYVGYLDNNYFTKVFKSIYKMSPSEYRRHGSKIFS